MAGEMLKDIGLVDDLVPERFYAKAPVFPFQKFPGVDVLLGPEMRSTGEVMGVGSTYGEAYLKAMIGAGMRLPQSGTVFFSVNDNDKETALPIARKLHELGFKIIGTRGTALYLFDHGIPAQLVFKVREGRPNVEDVIRNGDTQLVINTPLGAQSYFDERAIRIAASSHGVPCITTLSAAAAALEAMECDRSGELSVFAIQDTAA
jgi:carbamoyl-phosphate synthase large subunit